MHTFLSWLTDLARPFVEMASHVVCVTEPTTISKVYVGIFWTFVVLVMLHTLFRRRRRYSEPVIVGKPSRMGSILSGVFLLGCIVLGIVFTSCSV